MNTFRVRQKHEASTVKDIAIISAILSKSFYNQIFDSVGVHKQSEAYEIITDLAIDIFKAIEQEDLLLNSEQPEDIYLLLIVIHAQKILKEKYNINPLIL